MVILENIDINIDIDMNFLENINIDKNYLENIDIDIEKGILKKFDINKILYREIETLNHLMLKIIG